MTECSVQIQAIYHWLIGAKTNETPEFHLSSFGKYMGWSASRALDQIMLQMALTNTHRVVGEAELRKLRVYKKRNIILRSSSRKSTIDVGYTSVIKAQCYILC